MDSHENGEGRKLNTENTLVIREISVHFDSDISKLTAQFG